MSFEKYVEHWQHVMMTAVMRDLNKFRAGSKHPMPLLATHEFEHTGRVETVNCLRQKVIGNLLLQVAKVKSEGEQILKNYNDVNTYIERAKHTYQK